MIKVEIKKKEARALQKVLIWWKVGYSLRKDGEGYTFLIDETNRNFFSALQEWRMRRENEII